MVLYKKAGAFYAAVIHGLGPSEYLVGLNKPMRPLQWHSRLAHGWVTVQRPQSATILTSNKSHYRDPLIQQADNPMKSFLTEQRPAKPPAATHGHLWTISGLVWA